MDKSLGKCMKLHTTRVYCVNVHVSQGIFMWTFKKGKCGVSRVMSVFKAKDTILDPVGISAFCGPGFLALHLTC